MAVRDYPREGVTIHWDADVCIHSGVCARTLPSVFRPKERPWIDVEGAAAERIAATIDACPSGALTYTLAAGAPTTEESHVDTPAAPSPTSAPEDSAGVTITVSQDGPYEIAGPVSIVASDGVVIKEGEKLWLCRCGQSAAKPFCDGSHRKVGFTDSGLGAKREKELSSGQ